MTLQAKALCSVAALLIAGGLGLHLWTSHTSHKDQAAMVQAVQHETAATAAAAQGGAHDQAAQAQAAAVAAQAQQIQADKARIAALQTQLSKLRAKPVQPPAPGAAAPVAPDAGSVVDLQDQVIQAQEQTIQDQDAQIKAQGVLILDLTSARDSWKSAYEEEQKALVSERIAHDAAVAAQRAERWKGRGEGAVIGTLAGLVAAHFL